MIPNYTRRPLTFVASNDADEELNENQKNDRRRKALAVEEKSGEKNDESCTSSSSLESDSSEDEKGLLCLFSQEDSDEELCLMADEEEVTSQNHSSNYSSESTYHENPMEAFERMMKSFDGIEDSHLRLKEENAKLLAERQDLEDLRSKNAEMLESISQLEKQVHLLEEECKAKDDREQNLCEGKGTQIGNGGVSPASSRRVSSPRATAAAALALPPEPIMNVFAV
nr:lisH domain-containing protein C1711.05-like [Ipomoea batatas]